MLESVPLVPTRIVPSAEGGIAVCFVHGDRYADLECLNSGEILAVTYRGVAEPLVWEVAPESATLRTAIEHIRAHFNP